ncbi:hypothetical protein [Actinomadura fibrosa]|uniref:Transposase n=1 Tax=Actinomadura fibrosa TaxID=111802 RepID=A0ABW2X9C8_9ACTN|nr:hypothetical protein [Actinomadura fibrosa]
MTSSPRSISTPFGREHFARGYVAGLKKVRAEATAQHVLEVLKIRGVHILDDARAYINACTDQAEFDSLLNHALIAISTDALLGWAEPYVTEVPVDRS